MRWTDGPIGKGRVMMVLLAIGGAIALSIAALDDAIVSRQHETFVKTPCYIEESLITREPGNDGRNMPGWNYVPFVRYKYTVDGQEHTATTVSSRETPITTRAAADQFLLSFGPGSNAECFVNPEDPTDAMLLLPSNAQAKRTAQFGGLALLLAFCGLAALHISLLAPTAPRRPQPRAPGWGEVDSGPDDRLQRTRQMLRDKLDGR